MRFFEEKVHSLSVAPEPLAVWNKELEGLESDLFNELKSSHLVSVAPKPLAIWNKELEGLVLKLL